MCNVCGHTGEFLSPDLGREGSVCPNCSSSARSRALVCALGACLGTTDQPLYAWPRQEVRLLEASGRGGYPVFLAEKFCYTNGEYPAFDLEGLQYPDRSFDFVLAGDVFEHVRNDERAFEEVRRVLKPGGRLLITVPFEGEETLVRVDAEGRFLAPPEYHGGGGQSLAYRTYGRDLLGRLNKLGFAVAHLRVVDQDVFVCAKGAHLELTLAAPMADGPTTHLLPLSAWVIARYNLRALSQVVREVRSRLGR
jgi:SAM-dependent methyltransferase